jgi:hypothetical protein
MNEAAQLQGFPPNFTFEGQRNSLSFKQIGNAVHPGSARLVFNAIIQRAEMLKMSWASDFLITSQKYTSKNRYQSSLVSCELPDYDYEGVTWKIILILTLRLA